MSTQWYRVLVSKDERSSMHADSQVHWYAVAVVLCTKKGKAQCVGEVGTKAEAEKLPKRKGSAGLQGGECGPKLTVQLVWRLPKHARWPSPCAEVW